MKDRLIQYFSNISPLSAPEAAALEESMEVVKYNKGDYLIKEGQLNQDTFFLLQGCVRQFQLVNGNDITTNFFIEGQWIISLENAEPNKAAESHLICMEDTHVVIGDEQKAQVLFEKFPRFEKIARQVMETVFLEQQRWMTAYITDKPEQRYLTLMKTRPELLNRVPQYDIATFIGVKPESLSRIRKKLMGKH